MPQTKSSQECAIKEAWTRFHSDPNIATLPACGIASDSRLAKSELCSELKEAIKLRRNDLQRQRALQSTQTRSELRAHGFSFRNEEYAETNRTAKKRRLSYQASGACDDESLQEFLFFAVLHIVYDSVPAASFENVARQLAEILEILRVVKRHLIVKTTLGCNNVYFL
jgi:hypothetical protein